VEEFWTNEREHGKVHGIASLYQNLHLVTEAIIHTGKDLDIYVAYQNTIACILMYLLNFRLAVSYIHREYLSIE